MNVIFLTPLPELIELGYDQGRHETPPVADDHGILDVRAELDGFLQPVRGDARAAHGRDRARGVPPRRSRGRVAGRDRPAEWGILLGKFLLFFRFRFIPTPVGNMSS